jgi:hypothetical protein
MDLQLLEEKLTETILSYHRQLALSGNPRYDPKLTYALKKDIEWLESQKKLLENNNAKNFMSRAK